MRVTEDDDELKQPDKASELRDNSSAAEGVAKIRELRSGNRLDGLKIKDLIHEGHKY